MPSGRIVQFITFISVLLAVSHVRAESDHVRISHGYSSGYLPLMVMRDQHLLEKHAVAAGLPTPDVTWQALDGGNVINDAVLAGSIDIAGIGVPGFVTLWSKTHGIPRSEVVGVSAISGGTLWLNTNKASIHSLRDFSDQDKIAVPGIKTSFAAVALQMAVAKEFGIENYARLDPMTVGMPHPEAAAALMSGKTEITAHMASPPFNRQELAAPNVHRVVNTLDVFGPLTIPMTMAPRSFVNANPKLMAAFLAAIDDAIGFINAHRPQAAETYVRVMKSKVPVADILTILQDPESPFSATPIGTMEYARFLAHTGTIKLAPSAWTDMFITQIHNRDGS